MSELKRYNIAPSKHGRYGVTVEEDKKGGLYLVGDVIQRIREIKELKSQLKHFIELDAKQESEIERLKGERESVKQQVYRECQEEFRKRTAFILAQNKSLMDMLVNDKQVQPNVLGVDLSKDFMAQLKQDTLFDLRNAMNQEFKSKCETVGDQLTLHMFCEFINYYAAQQLKTAGEGDE